MKNTLLLFYLVVGISLCGWYTVAAAYRWKSPDFGIMKALSEGSSGGGYYGGRSYGGAWGGGK
jgi:hypothetical protein